MHCQARQAPRAHKHTWSFTLLQAACQRVCTYLEAPPADARDVAQVVDHDGHDRGVPVAQHVQAQLLQARPEVVGVVVQLLDLARATVSAVLALQTKDRQQSTTDRQAGHNAHTPVRENACTPSLCACCIQPGVTGTV
jgi:hypothetical protein